MWSSDNLESEAEPETWSFYILEPEPEPGEYSESEDEVEIEPFPIMELPVEVRAKIFRMISQREITQLRLICQQWRREIDQFYEFSVNIYGNVAKYRPLRLRECTIWRLTLPPDVDDEAPILYHPGYLKTIKIYGPIQAEVLQRLITSTINLENLTVTRRANYPKILNLDETPGLANLTKLKFLRLNSEEHVVMAPRFDFVNSILNLPMMDCYFPSLKHFEILKRFPGWNSASVVTVILKFVARHARTLETLELDLIPLTSIPNPDLEPESDDSLEDGDFIQPGVIVKFARPDLAKEAIDVPSLSNLRLQKCCITTKGSKKDVVIWKDILQKQDSLKELRFDWLCNDPRAEILSRITGFPWVFFRDPISKCADTLVTVELANLSMIAKDNTSHRVQSQILPFDLRVFRECNKLKNLMLRCRENHGRVDLENEGQGDGEDFPQAEPEEVLLMINGGDLPNSIEKLILYYFTMLTADIVAIIRKCQLLNKLFLNQCGRTRNLGVTASVIREMSNLSHLKFLEVIGFNDSTAEKRTELELVFRALGLPYEGQDTWLDFDNGNSPANDALKQLNEPME